MKSSKKYTKNTSARHKTVKNKEKDENVKKNQIKQRLYFQEKNVKTDS